MSASNTVGEVMEAKKRFGFTGMPVTESGRMGGRLEGLITQRDVDFLSPDQSQHITVGEVRRTLASELKPEE